MLYEDVFNWFLGYLSVEIYYWSHFLIPSSRKNYWCWQTRICFQAGWCVRIEYPTVYLWNHLGQKWCLEMGLDSLPFCTVYFLVLVFCEFYGFCNMGKVIGRIVYMGFGLETRSNVVSWLIVAAWWWVVSAVLWSFCAGRDVETPPQGWIYAKGFIIAGLYTIYTGEMKAWFEKVLPDLKRTNCDFKTEVSGNLSSLFT